MKDRKSTRLNSSHVSISYAVFFLHRPPAPVFDTLSLHDALPIFRHQSVGLSLNGRIQIFARDLQNNLLNFHARLFVLRLKVVVLIVKFFIGNLQLGAGLVLIDERSEEHTSELQSRFDLVCRLLLASPSSPSIRHSFPTRRSSDLSSPVRRP